MSLLVRVRPNATYLLVLLLVAVMAVVGLSRGGLMAAGGVVLLAIVVILAYPLIASTLLGQAALMVTREGIAFPLMGPSLRWNEVADVRWSEMTIGTTSRPVILVVPARPDLVLQQVRPWLRSDVRKRLARFGTPLVIADNALNRPVDDIFAAIEHLRSG